MLDGEPADPPNSSLFSTHLLVNFPGLSLFPGGCVCGESCKDHCNYGRRPRVNSHPLLSSLLD